MSSVDLYDKLRCILHGSPRIGGPTIEFKDAGALYDNCNEEMSNDYHALFTHYISGGVQESLSRVRMYEYAIPDPVREQAWHVLSFALAVDEAWEVTKELLLELAPKMEQAGFRTAWIPYLENGVKKSRSHADRISEGHLMYHLGLLSRLTAQHSTACMYFNASIALFASVSHSVFQAKALNQLAYTAWQQGQAEETIRCANFALSLLPNDHIESAMAYSALGLIAIEQRQFVKAEREHRKALDIRRKYGDKRLIAWSLQNVGAALSWQKKYPEAIQHYADALEMLEAIQDRANMGIVYMNIGLAEHYRHRFLDALQKYENAESIFKTLEDRLNLVRLFTNQGLTHYLMENFSDAEFCFMRAIQLSTELGNDALRLNATDGLIMVKIAQQRYDEAKELLMKAMAELDRSPVLPNYQYLSESLRSHQSLLNQVEEQGIAYTQPPVLPH